MERNRNRKSGGIFYLLIGGLLLLGTAVLAFSLGGERRQEQYAQERPSPSPAAAEIRLPEDTPAVIVPAEVLAEDASVVIRYRHTPCGHAYDVKLDPKETKGLSKSDLIIRYSNMKLAEFSPEGAVLECALASYCPEHYLVKLTNGRLCIYRTKTGGEDQMLIKELATDPSALDAQELEKGVLFDTMEDIESFLENIES